MSNWTRSALMGFAATLAGAGVWLAFRDSTGGATATYVLAAIVLAFAFLDQIASVSGIGFKMQTVDRKIREADEMITRLRGLAASVSTPLFILAARGGRWDSGMTRRERLDFVRTKESELQLIGVAQDRIDECKRETDRAAIYDLSLAVLDPYSRLVRDALTAATDALQKLPQPYRTDDPAFIAASTRQIQVGQHQARRNGLLTRAANEDIPQAVVSYVSTPGILPDDALKEFLAAQREAILDLQEYAETKKFRRVTEWLAADPSPKAIS